MVFKSKTHERRANIQILSPIISHGAAVLSLNTAAGGMRTIRVVLTLNLDNSDTKSISSKFQERDKDRSGYLEPAHVQEQEVKQTETPNLKPSTITAVGFVEAMNAMLATTNWNVRVRLEMIEMGQKKMV